MKTASIVLCLVILGINGCTSNSVNMRETIGLTKAQKERIRALEGRWVGHKFVELRSELGPPQSIFEANPIAIDTQYWNKAHAFLYSTEPDEKTGCKDVFLISIETGEILKYYCL